MQGTSNQTSQDSLQQELPQRWTGGPGFRKKRDPAEAALAATPGVQRIVENQPTFRQYLEDLLWTATRSEVEGDIRYRSGNWQQDVVRSRSPIKWSTPQPWMDTAQGTTSPGRMMERKHRILGSPLEDKFEGCQTMDHMRYEKHEAGDRKTPQYPHRVQTSA